MIFKNKIQNKNFYTIILKSEVFENSEVMCTGKQFAQILKLVSPVIMNYNWYIADVDYIFWDDSESKNSLDELQAHMDTPLLMKDTQNLINYVMKVDQFMSGVFLAIKDDLKLEISDRKYYDTENPEPYLEFADIDIRAFDTSFIMAFTSRKDIADLLLEFKPEN